MGRASRRKRHLGTVPEPQRYQDYPLAELELAMSDYARRGALVFLKWTCEGCGARVGLAEPNAICEIGACEHCGHRTDVRRNGGNYLLAFQLGDLDNLRPDLTRHGGWPA